MHNFKLDCTLSSDIQFARLTQATVIYGMFSGLHYSCNW